MQPILLFLGSTRITMNCRWMPRLPTRYRMGHLEVNGLRCTKVSDEGKQEELFRRFETVFMDTFITSQMMVKSFIFTPYEIFWNDHDDPKGFISLTPTQEDLSVL